MIDFRSCLNFFLIIFLSLISNLASAQTFKDVVYLKNGSVAKGKIIGFDSLDRLKIQTYQDYFLVFPKSEIKQFIIRGDEDEGLEKENYEKSKGYLNVTQLGISLGYRKQNQFQPRATYTDFTFESFSGYQFNSHLAAGAIVGLDIYSDGTLYPVGGSLRGSLLKKKVTPTAFVAAGHALEFHTKEKETQDFKGGFFWTAGLGLMVKNSQKTAFTFSLLYKQQNASLRTTNWIWEENESYTTDQKLFRRVSIMMGFSF